MVAIPTFVDVLIPVAFDAHKPEAPPPPPVIVIVLVAPVPEAVTFDPTKFNVVANVDRELPSS